MTFSDESKISFNGKSELSTECSKVTAIDFPESALCLTTELAVSEPSVAFSDSVFSCVSAEYTLYERATRDVTTNAAATYFGFLLLDMRGVLFELIDNQIIEGNLNPNSQAKGPAIHRAKQSNVRFRSVTVMSVIIILVGCGLSIPKSPDSLGRIGKSQFTIGKSQVTSHN